MPTHNSIKPMALVALVVALVTSSQPVLAAPPVFPSINVGLSPTGDPAQVAQSLQILLLLTILSLAPSILVMTTSFTRLVIVLSFTRSALGTQQMPPNQVMIGLALLLTLFIMAPIFGGIYQDAWLPYSRGEMQFQTALEVGAQPLRDFMIRQTREKDLALFVSAAQIAPESVEQVPTHVLIPAFVISELKTAFQMGFMIFLPFLVIDMVVASTLMSMGMMMLPPVMISLPFKILLFVMVDGWHLVVRSLLMSFQ